MTITAMDESHREAVSSMMRDFYSSDAVSSNGSEEVFRRDIDECLSDSPFLEGYVFADNGTIVGYGMVARSFSTEYGMQCVWIEDVYVKPDFRSQGIGTAFIEYVASKNPDCLMRLEAADDNPGALRLYEALGFTALPYISLCKTAAHG